MAHAGSVREPRGLILPAWGYYLVFLLAPLLFILPFAFADRQGFFDITFGFYTDNFERLWDPVFFRIYRDTLFSAAIGTFGCLLVGYPFAYWLGTRVRKHKTLLMLLVVIPFWTSILIRTYAWELILRPEGPLYDILHGLGLVAEPLGILGSTTAVAIGLIYNYLPLMVFPLFVSIDRLDRRVLDASRDLGGNRWSTFRRVTWPLTLPGVMTGCLLVFVPMTGEYVVPTFLGGGKGRWFGPIVADQFLEALNYPFGAAMSVVLAGFLFIVIFAYLRAIGGRAEDALGPVL